MSDTDEIRALLSDALRLPGEVHARPGAAEAIRARARSRRRAAVATFAAAVPACLVVAALLAGTIGPSDSSVAPPASRVTAAPSPSGSYAAVVISIAPGPRNLMSPIAIRPVLQEYQICPPDGPTVPAAVGPHCYRLGPAALVVHRLRDLGTRLATRANGTEGDHYELNLTMTAHDTAAFSALTAAMLHKQVAYVVDGKVWLAPSIESHITEGMIQIQVPTFRGAAQALVTELTG